MVISLLFHKHRKWATGIVIIALIVLFEGPHLANSIVKYMLISRLHTLGLQGITIDQVSITPRHLKLSRIHLSNPNFDSIAIDKIEADFALSDWIFGTLKKLTVIGTNISAHSNHFSVSIPTFSITAKREQDSDQFSLVVNMVCHELSLSEYGKLIYPLILDIQGNGTIEDIHLTKISLSTDMTPEPMLVASGKFKPHEQQGTLQISKAHINLKNLYDLTPFLKGLGIAIDPKSINGITQVTGGLFWSGNWLSPKSSLIFSLKGIGFKSPKYAVSDLTGTLKILNLNPFATPPHQILKAKRIKLPSLDINDAHLDFSFNQDGDLTLNQLIFRTMDADITVHDIRALSKNIKDGVDLKFKFDGINLTDLLKLADIPGLAGTAKLSGNGAFKVTSEEFMLTQLFLHSISKEGHLAYTPHGTETVSRKDGDPKGALLALEALQDFRFTVLETTINSNALKEMRATIKIHGFNPKMLNGFPFEFTITTTGKLKELILNTLQNFQLPTNMNQLSKTLNNRLKSGKQN